MSTLTLSDITLEDLLPHRGAMLLVGEVLAVDSRNATALFVVDLAWPMADEHGVHPLILVEMAAQTAGICNGWGRIQTKGKDSEQMGWLVGLKRQNSSSAPCPLAASSRLYRKTPTVLKACGKSPASSL